MTGTATHITTHFAHDDAINTDFDSYQSHVAATAQHSNHLDVDFFAIGIAGETGELCEKVKKWKRGDFELDAPHKEEMAKELGDILWFISRCAEKLGYSLSDVVRLNNEKLADRRARSVTRGEGDNR